VRQAGTKRDAKVATFTYKKWRHHPAKTALEKEKPVSASNARSPSEDGA
jgi:hypothetical protein